MWLSFGGTACAPSAPAGCACCLHAPSERAREALTDSKAALLCAQCIFESLREGKKENVFFYGAEQIEESVLEKRNGINKQRVTFFYSKISSKFWENMVSIK